MHRILFLTQAAFLCITYTTTASAQDATLQRIQELELRLERAEALIRHLMEKTSPTPVLESIMEKPQPISAPEVLRSQTQPSSNARQMPQELLPNLGQIGATSSFAIRTHSGPYSGGRGTYFSGAVSLPLMKAPGGQLLYEFSAGLTQSESSLRLTSNVAQVANLAVLGPGALTDALRGTGAAPFPVIIDTRSNLDVLQVLPFTLKYQSTRLARWKLRPYATLGFGLYVTISNQTTLTGLRSDANLPPELKAALATLFGNGAPFGGALIGGQITAARELTALGIPSGQGGISPGFQTGTGLEWRWKPRFSWGVDLRWNRLNGGANFYTIAPRGSFHF